MMLFLVDGSYYMSVLVQMICAIQYCTDYGCDKRLLAQRQ